MKVKIKVYDFAAEPGLVTRKEKVKKEVIKDRIERTYDSSDILPKTTKKKKEREEIIEIGTFPKDLEAYLKHLLPRKLLGLFKDIRDIMGSRVVKNYKTAFEYGWKIKILEVNTENSKIIPKGAWRSFQYGSKKKTMGWTYSDTLDQFEVLIDVRNKALEEGDKDSKAIFKEAIGKLDALRFGPLRNATIEVISIE